MKNLALSFVLGLLLWQCAPDQTGAKEQAPATTTAQPATPTANAPASTNTVPAESTYEMTPTKATPPTTEQALLLIVNSVDATPGGTACIDIHASGFTNLIGLQYTLRWDADKLEFQAVKNFNLRYLDERDFGLRFIDKGYLISSWIDESLKGITLAEGTPIYQLCFTVKGKAGDRARVRFDNSPAPYEVIDKQEAILQFKSQAGGVDIR